MVYDGTNNSELIVFHTVEDSDYKHFIELYKYMNSQVLSVGCCCDRDWGYKFFMTSNSDYERIKFNIMEAVFECEDVDELLDTLDEIFVMVLAISCLKMSVEAIVTVAMRMIIMKRMYIF